MNLLEETLEKLIDNNRSASDVEWCGCREFWFNWNHFVELAKDLDYHDGFGGNEIAMDLLVVGKDFWLERHEYDGSEWWEFKSMPDQPDGLFVPDSLNSDGGTLADCLEIEIGKLT